MKYLSEKHLLSIAADQVASLTCLVNMECRVLEGKIWVTASGILEDFWLGKGDTLELERDRLIVIEACSQASSVELTSIGTNTAAPDRYPAALSRKIGFQDGLGSVSKGNWMWNAVKE